MTLENCSRRSPMKSRTKWKTGWPSLLIVACLLWLAPEARPQAQATLVRQDFVKDLSKGPSWFPAFLRPYQQQPIAPATLENSDRLHSLIHDGKLELSLADALALALENNLDISVQRYLIPISQTDVLRTSGGQAARGVSGALVPSGLSAGALGAGISAAAGGGGVGSAGGITGGGGTVNIPSVGNFDPSVNFAFSWDRATTPLNTRAVAGVNTVTGYATAYSGTYAQLFPTGTSYFVSLNGLRQSSTSQNLLFNPAVVTRLSMAFNQPLLSGLGIHPHHPGNIPPSGGHHRRSGGEQLLGSGAIPGEREGCRAVARRVAETL
jgi:hypothetical protein